MEEEYQSDKNTLHTKKRTKNSRKIKELEKLIVEQTMIIKEAKAYYDELVNELYLLKNTV